MTTQCSTAVVVSGLALIVIPVIAGCESMLETNEAACRRAMNHLEECLIEVSGTGFSVPVSQLCEGPIEPVGPGLSAVADCVTSLSCAQLLVGDPTGLASTAECATAYELVGDVGRNIFEGLPGFGPPDPSPGPSACEPLTGFEICLLTGTCLPDCSDTSPAQDVPSDSQPESCGLAFGSADDTFLKIVNKLDAHIDVHISSLRIPGPAAVNYSGTVNENTCDLFGLVSNHTVDVTITKCDSGDYEEDGFPVDCGFGGPEKTIRITPMPGVTTTVEVTNAYF